MTAESFQEFLQWLHGRTYPGVFARGQSYFADHRVQSLRPSKGGWMAVVRGSHRYTVLLNPETRKMNCNCPAPMPCKHIVALALQLDHDYHNEAGAPLPLPSARQSAQRAGHPPTPSSPRSHEEPGVKRTERKKPHLTIECISGTDIFHLAFRGPDGYRLEPRGMFDFVEWLPPGLIALVARSLHRSFSVGFGLEEMLADFPKAHRPELRFDGQRAIIAGVRNAEFELLQNQDAYTIRASPRLRTADIRAGFTRAGSFLAAAPPGEDGVVRLLHTPVNEKTLDLHRMRDHLLDLRTVVSRLSLLRRAKVKGLDQIPSICTHGPLPLVTIEPLSSNDREDLLGLNVRLQFVYAETRLSRSEPPSLESLSEVALFPPYPRTLPGDPALAKSYPGLTERGRIALRDLTREEKLVKPLRDKGLITKTGTSRIGRKHLATFFLKHLPELRRHRIPIRMPDSLLSLGRTPGSAAFHIEESPRTDWFGGRIEIPGLSPRDMERALIAAKRKQAHVLLSDGRWLRLEDLRLERILSTLDSLGLKADPSGNVGKISTGQLTALVSDVEARTDRLGETTRAKILAWAMPASARDGNTMLVTHALKGLRGTLRSYQKTGVAFLMERHRAGIGAILADDMGLGKTVQGLAFLNALSQTEKKSLFLIVGPPAALGVWQREAERFCPGLPVTLWHGSERKDTDAPARGIILTSYGTLHRDEKILSLLTFETILVDEAQYIKNHNSLAAKTLRNLRFKTLFGLTGTPVENHPTELWSLMDLVLPGLLGSLTAFRRSFGSNVQPEALARLRRRVSPFVLRRTRDAVLRDLPLRSVQDLNVPMTHRQGIEYERVRREAVKVLASAGADYLMKMLPYLMKLRRIACHPDLTSAKADPLLSGKILQFSAMADEIEETAHGILVFSQFTDVLDVFGRYLDSRRSRYLRIDGSTTARKREALVHEFQKGSIPYFLISLRAGGTALTLHRADTVLHLDPWWNPAVEEQATARAHRMGQERPVFVYRFFSEGTVEEKVALLQQKKRQLFEGLFGQAQSRATKISRDDLIALLTGGDP